MLILTWEFVNEWETNFFFFLFFYIQGFIILSKHSTNHRLIQIECVRCILNASYTPNILIEDWSYLHKVTVKYCRYSFIMWHHYCVGFGVFQIILPVLNGHISGITYLVFTWIWYSCIQILAWQCYSACFFTLHYVGVHSINAIVFKW